MPGLAQLHDLILHCPECKLRKMDALRVELEVAAGRAVVVDVHSGCGHILAYRNIWPEAVPIAPVPVRDRNGYTAALPDPIPLRKPRRKKKDLSTAAARAWRALSA